MLRLREFYLKDIWMLQAVYDYEQESCDYEVLVLYIQACVTDKYFSINGLYYTVYSLQKIII